MKQLTWDILVATERSNNLGLVREELPVLGSRREQTLEERRGGIEDRRALCTNLHADVHLSKVDKIGPDAPDVRRAVRVEVVVTQVRAQLV